MMPAPTPVGRMAMWIPNERLHHSPFTFMLVVA